MQWLGHNGDVNMIAAKTRTLTQNPPAGKHLCSHENIETSSNLGWHGKQKIQPSKVYTHLTHLTINTHNKKNPASGDKASLDRCG